VLFVGAYLAENKSLINVMILIFTLLLLIFNWCFRV